MSVVRRALLAWLAAAVASAAGCGLSDKDVAHRRRNNQPPRPAAGTNGGAGAGGDAAGAGGESEVAGRGGGDVESGTGSTGEPGGGGGNAPPSFDAGTAHDRNAVVGGELCDRLATIQCAGEGACCPSAGRNFDACKSDLTATCNSKLLFDQIAAQPSAGFDAVRTHTVIDEIERLAAACDPGLVAFNGALHGPRSMFAGTVGPDQSCRPSNVLSTPQGAAAVVACTMAESQACLPSLTTWTCTPRGGAGSPCFTDFNCFDGFFCPNPNLDLAGANCAARKADDAGCAAGNECASLFCGGGRCVPPSVEGAYCPG